MRNLSLAIIQKELERLSARSQEPGQIGLSYDEVKTLEILIRTGELLKRAPLEDPEPQEKDFSKVSDQELEKLLR